MLTTRMGEQRLRLQRRAIGARLEMLDLIEIELTRVRRMAEHADDGFLLYLLDMAILEANRRARSITENRVAANDEARRLSGSNESRHNLVAELKVVR